MILLICFAFLAGAATALSPCVLPVLPVVLAAGATGGRRRPLGIATGIVLSFTFAVVALVYVIDAFGLPDDLLRWVAIATLAGFGLLLLVPALSDRLEAWISRLVPGPARVEGDGFWSGFVLGLSLGLVYAPCAGPILAGVITVSAAQDFTAGRLAVAFAYSLGSGVVLYGLALGGRSLIARARPAQAKVRLMTGALMVALALAMVANLDQGFRDAISEDLPAFVYNPTGDLEDSSAIASELESLSGRDGAEEGGAGEVARGARLPDLGRAPDFTATQEWFNTPGGEPLSIERLTGEGRVVLIDFWTYTCINCIRTLPYLEAWDSRYRDQGLTIVGVHSPEFAFEKDAGNVAAAIDAEGIEYPVVQDNELGTWSAFGNRYWPAKYLIDADGEVRYVHFGEGDYETTEAAIRSLLAEAGDHDLGGRAQASTQTIDPGLGTPETYAGYARAQGWVNGPAPGIDRYDAPDPADLKVNDFAYGGRWRVGPEAATALAGGELELRFEARRVFLVMGAEPGAARIRVELDGKPIDPGDAGSDVEAGAATVSGQRLYRLVDLPRAGVHTLELELEPGISAYAFTFG